MKKLFTILAMLLAFAVVLAACTNNNDDGNGGLGTVDNGNYDLDPDYDFDFDLDGGFGGGDGWVDPDGNPDPALAAMIAQLYEGIEDMPFTMDAELTAANFANFVSIDYIPGARGVVSQAVISAVPHAVVLIELPEGADAAAIAAEIEEAANLDRWICVEAEKAQVFTAGNFVVFAMSFENVVNGVGANIDTVLG